MSEPTRYATPPVELLLDQEPKPVPGCGVCTALGKERGEAKAKGDGSKGSDMNVEILNHPHKGRGRK